jgi:hypothetical protein
MAQSEQLAADAAATTASSAMVRSMEVGSRPAAMQNSVNGQKPCFKSKRRLTRRKVSARAPQDNGIGVVRSGAVDRQFKKTGVLGCGEPFARLTVGGDHGEPTACQVGCD